MLGRSLDYSTALESLNELEDDDDDEDDDDSLTDGNLDDELTWKEEADKTLRQVLVPGHTVEDVATELNTTKFAHNVTFNDIRTSVVAFIMGEIDLANYSASAKEVCICGEGRGKQRQFPLVVGFVTCLKCLF